MSVVRRTMLRLMIVEYVVNKPREGLVRPYPWTLYFLQAENRHKLPGFNHSPCRSLKRWPLVKQKKFHEPITALGERLPRTSTQHIVYCLIYSRSVARKSVIAISIL